MVLARLHHRFFNLLLTDKVKLSDLIIDKIELKTFFKQLQSLIFFERQLFHLLRSVDTSELCFRTQHIVQKSELIESEMDQLLILFDNFVVKKRGLLLVQSGKKTSHSCLYLDNEPDV